MTLKVPPLPTLEELIVRWGLTEREYKRLFDGHDPGDEDSKTRRYGKWVKEKFW